MVKFSVLHKTLSVTLSFLVLCSTFSIAINKHFCGDTLIDVAVFSSAKKCGGMTADTTFEITKKSCCKDELTLIKGETKLIHYAVKTIKNTTVTFYLPATYAFRLKDNRFYSTPIIAKEYPPPLKTVNLQILHNSFLI